MHLQNKLTRLSRKLGIPLFHNSNILQQLQLKQRVCCFIFEVFLFLDVRGSLSVKNGSDNVRFELLTICSSFWLSTNIDFGSS